MQKFNLSKASIRETFPMADAIPFVIVLIVIIVSLLAMTSCSSTKPVTQLVHDIRTDTLYLSNIQYDSIYINRTSDIDRTRDTVTITKTLTEYRYKLLRDTIYRVQRDSIPYRVTITEIKEVTRPLTWFDHLTRFCFVLVFGFLFVSFVRIVFKLKSKIRV